MNGAAELTPSEIAFLQAMGRSNGIVCRQANTAAEYDRMTALLEKLGMVMVGTYGSAGLTKKGAAVLAKIDALAV